MFSLSLNIDSQKAFIIKRSDLLGRIDATPYKKMFSFISNKYENKKLSEVAFINPNTSFLKLDNNEEITFIPMEAVDDKDGVIIKTFTKKVGQSNGFTRFMQGDLIWAKITPCMQNGKSAVVNNTLNGFACGSTEFYVIRPKNESIKAEYLHYLLRDQRILDNAQNFFGGSAGQQRVSKDFLINFVLPIPPYEVQESIVRIISDSYLLKQLKEVQAKELIENIDNYLLNELSITLPTKDSSYSNRTFEVKWSEISGDRFDAFSFFNSAIKIEGGIYENKKLRELATVNKGQSITSSNVVEGHYPVIAGGKTSPYSHNEYNYDGKTITVSASGAYSGFVWYHNEPIFASDCAVIKSKDETIITMDFLSEILKLKQTEIYGLQQGAGQPHVYPSDLIKLDIPVPPIDIQERITTHIFELREKARQLETEAKEVLDNAKREIEKMIIG